MNLYFLVEGKRTEKKVYPKWLSTLTPNLTQVSYAQDVETNNFYLISGEGYPSLLNHLKNAIAEINEIKKYDFLILCLDAEETSTEEQKETIAQYVSQHNLTLDNAQLVVIVQNPCFETWFLGNRKVFKRNPQSEILNEYISFYNVQTADPELMPTKDENLTKAQFHCGYLQEVFIERNITYSKKNPKVVCEDSFLQEIIDRNKETNHLPSFKELFDFCQSIH